MSATDACSAAIKRQEERIAHLLATKSSDAAALREEQEKLKQYQICLATLSSQTGAAKRAKKAPERKGTIEVTTLPDGKKDTSNAPEAYDPIYVESAWYQWWEACGMFDDNKATARSDEKFVLVIPPPNVTGSLHIGHALTNTIEDALVRWHRMLGHRTVWVFGTDHAGIATQAVVEKRLQAETGQSRHDLGREAFTQRVWDWKNQYQSRIESQLRRLGASLDWSHPTFTLDDTRARAVTEAFVRWFEQGLIYRETRLVNWCCKLNTALSDIEVDYITLEEPTRLAVPGHGTRKYDFGRIWSFKYRIVDSDETITIATTRPETLLGDTAVAVHPEDQRYKHLHGRRLQCPFADRTIPIILDAELVDMEFGTGAVKVTPAHDPRDYATGKRHGLDFISVMDDTGVMNANAGRFAGMRRFDCRDAIIPAMEQLGLYEGSAANPMRIGVCSRTGDIIEPMLKPQWWVHCDKLAADALAAVENGDLKIIPEMHKVTWKQWLGNIQDWCISRQLWWGHRIPAYMAWTKDSARPDESDAANWFVARSDEEAMTKAAEILCASPDEIQLHRDPDVLDTWFSSGLFPFSAFGWPDNSDPRLDELYPTSLLETGHDILFFWVARMVFMGQSLTGKLPFPQVFLHAMVRDAHGRKMSKSLGNVVDPIDVIEGIELDPLHAKLFSAGLDPREIDKAIKGQRSDYPDGIGECGTDALRFALCNYTSHGRDINLNISKVVSYRFFCNKLWNAVRFAMRNMGEYTPQGAQDSSLPTQFAPQDVAQTWILDRLGVAVAEVNRCMHEFDLSGATNALHTFWYAEFCDVFLEAIKPLMQSTEADDVPRQNATREALYTCLEVGLRLLHPFMPFVTEELWQRLPRRASETAPSIMLAQFPLAAQFESYRNAQAAAHMALLNDIIHSARSLRMTYSLKPSARPDFSVLVASEADCAVLRANYTPAFLTLAGGASVTFASQRDALETVGSATNIVNADLAVYLRLRGLVDPAQEIAKLKKQQETSTKALESLTKRRGSAAYSRVPADIQEKDTARIAELTTELESIQAAITMFESL